MRQFFKIMFASMLGTILVFIVGFFVLLGIIAGIAAAGSKDAPVIKEKTILIMKLDQPFGDQTSSNPFENITSFSLNVNPPLGLNELLNTIKKAKTDNRIMGIYMNLSAMQTGWATLFELRKALEDFKTSKKFLYTYAEVLDQKAYYIASVSDKIFMNAEGNIDFTGIAFPVVFYKNALEKIGVETQIIRHGKYKSAVEPFFMDHMSAENRAQIKEFSMSIWNTVLADISKSRNIPVEKLNMIADNLSAWDPAGALENNIIDGIFSAEEMERILKDLVEINHEEKYQNITIERYAKIPDPEKNSHKTKAKIAVIYASGDIVLGKGGTGNIGSLTLSKDIREATEDENVKAIVLRINSPGGSSLASEVIYNLLALAKEKKPIVASFGDMAASGGYYIACGANKIIANPSTITGSIGVFGVVPNAKKLLNDKLGLNVDVEKTNENADFMALYRPLSPKEHEVISLNIEKVYNTFVSHVAAGRNLDKHYVDSIAQGHVWSGADAKKIGLIDELGGLPAAITTAATLSGIKDYKIEEYPKRKSIPEQLFSEIGNVKTSMLKNEMGEYYPIYKTIHMLNQKRDIQARLPYIIME